MKRTIDELRAYCRAEVKAYSELETAGYVVWGDSHAVKGKPVSVEKYGEGESWRRGDFPVQRWYFKNFQDAAANLLRGVA